MALHRWQDDVAMNLRRALILTAVALLLAPMARSGHEQPVYPSYYPHEIEIATVEPQKAGDLLGAGKLHAYVGGAPGFAAAVPKDVASVPSLGTFVVVKINPGSALAKDEAAACGVVAAVARVLAARGGGDVIAHPYPITPLHGDYLHHADLAEAAIVRFVGAAANLPDLPAPTIGRVRAEGALAQSIVPPGWRADGTAWDAAIEEVDAGRLVASAITSVN